MYDETFIVPTGKKIPSDNHDLGSSTNVSNLIYFRLRDIILVLLLTRVIVMNYFE